RKSGRWGSRPYLSKHAREVASEHADDLRVRILPPNQTFREIEHPLRMGEPLDVDLLAEPVAPLVARAQLLVHLRRQVVVAIEIHVATDAEVLGTDQLL